MEKPGIIPNVNTPELNPNETGVNVDIEKKPEVRLTPAEQLKNIENEVEIRRQEIIKLTESTKETRSKLDEARENLGLPPTEDDPQDVLLNKERLEKLKAEQDDLEKQREEIITRQEKEELIKKEKEKILQEKIDELFEEFAELQKTGKFESVFMGHTNFESKSMGSIDPETAQSLAKAFREGVKLLPEILKNLPDLLKRLDDDLTKEAEKRVEEKLEEAKNNIGKRPEEPKIEKPKEDESEIYPVENKQETVTVEM